jgi:aarF domain-containing kinase
MMTQPRISIKVKPSLYLACLYNDGLYVKFGQGIAASDHLLPPPFFKWMSKLQDQAKSCTYDVITKVFED